MLTRLNALASRRWSQLLGTLITMVGIAVGLLYDFRKNSTYDATACAFYGGNSCEEAVLPSGLSLALTVASGLLVLFVLSAMLVKLSSRKAGRH